MDKKTFVETRTLAYNRQDWIRLVQRSLEQRPYDPGGLRDQYSNSNIRELSFLIMETSKRNAVI